jgi:farnesyl diphosphate synthase
MKTTPNPDYLRRFEKALRSFLENYPFPAKRLQLAVEYALFPGGKRIRPMLVYAVAEILEIAEDCLDSIACAVECMHAYSLVHDDLPAMDNDDYRRGKPSCHKAFDEATAILVGDGLQAFALELLLQTLPLYLPQTQVFAILQELLLASGFKGMVSGQSLDMSELSTLAVTEPLLTHIHELKTGKLFHACIQMVLAASTPSSLEKEQLILYAKHLGLAFQMQDDYLDGYSSASSLGKIHASDQKNQKQTFATLFSQEELQYKITSLFQAAIHALTPLGEKTVPLILFTRAIYSLEQGELLCP